VQPLALDRPASISIKPLLVLLFAALVTVLVPFSEQAFLLTLVLLLGVLTFGPAWVRWQQGKLDAFESVHVLGLVYFVYFGLGAIWLVQDPVRNAYDIYLVPYVPRAVVYCTLGFGALLCGYFGPWWRAKARWETITRIRSGLFLIVPAGLGLVGYLADATLSHARWLGVSVPRGVSSVAQLAPLYLYVWSLGWLLVFSGQATRWQRRLVVFVLLPATLGVLSVSLTNKSGTMTMIGIPLMALWYARKKLPWKSLVALVLILVFFVFPFYNTYRLLDARVPRLARVVMTYDLIRSWDLDRYFLLSVGVFKFRMAMINSVAVTIRDTGRWVPFEKGGTIFLPTAMFLIPSFLWADKPQHTMGLDVAETFRVTHILDRETRIEITVPGELYWNFDLPGILVGMLIWGTVMRWLYRRYAEDDPLDPVRRAFHLLILVQWVHFGAGLATQGVLLIRTLVVLEVYLAVAKRLDLTETIPAREEATGQTGSA
jgi:hypothetical protein